MDDARVMGQLLRLPDGSLVGWCWSPDRPFETLTCEILADETVIAMLRAAGFMQHLLTQGIGDGRHAFRLDPTPASVDTALLLTAREAGTGAIFGRLRIPDRTALSPRVAAIASGMRDARERLADAPPATRHAVSLRHGLAGLAHRLSGPPDLRQPRHTSAVDLPPCADPAASVLLLARTAASAAATVAALAPALSGQLGDGAAELLVAHLGGDPATALLAGTHLSPGRTLTPSEAVSRALCVARGHRLVVLDDIEPAPSAAALAVLLDDPDPLICSPYVATLAARLNLGLSPSSNQQLHCPASPSPCGRGLGEGSSDQRAVKRTYLPLLFAADRDTLLQLGGLDPALDDDILAAILDLCLKAALLGIPTRIIPASPGPVPPPIAALPSAALDLLAARWGRMRPEAS